MVWGIIVSNYENNVFFSFLLKGVLYYFKCVNLHVQVSCFLFVCLNRNILFTANSWDKLEQKR